MFVLEVLEKILIDTVNEILIFSRLYLNKRRTISTRDNLTRFYLFTRMGDT